MNTPNNKRKKESQEKIEKTFLQLIQKKSIEDITISDICKISKLNRSTFYSNYMDIYDLVEKIKTRMENEFASIFVDDTESGHNKNTYLKLFKHIKDNQIFYRTYFNLKFDTKYQITNWHEDLALKYYNNKHIDYHCEFFKAGLTALVKKWINNNCNESPEEMLEILISEYTKQELQ